MAHRIELTAEEGAAYADRVFDVLEDLAVGESLQVLLNVLVNVLRTNTDRRERILLAFEIGQALMRGVQR
jgi:uncharacterized protein YejL (UPF0352 family)